MRSESISALLHSRTYSLLTEQRRVVHAHLRCWRESVLDWLLGRVSGVAEAFPPLSYE